MSSHSAVTPEQQSRLSDDLSHETPAADEAAEANNRPPTVRDGATESPAHLDHVLQSDIGITTLLNRLKQSVSSTRDFASFLKKRSSTEEEHAQSLKKLSRGTFELIRRPENRQGTFAQNYEQTTRIHDRMADNGLQFASALHQMSDELHELAANMERGRKHWKQSGLNAEKRVQDSEAAMEKAKNRYDSLAEQYDRARTGDRQSGRFGLKGPKSAAQQEEDLFRKVQASDADYAGKVQAAQAQRQELTTTLRPQAISALRELISECDSGLTLQLQKFASLNEQLLLRNGLCVSPLKSQTNGALPESRSLREVAQQIDNEGDFRDYVLSFSNNARTRPPSIRYVKHPALASPKQTPPSQPPPPQTYNSPLPSSGYQPQGASVPAVAYEQGHRPPQPGQISGVTPVGTPNRDGLGISSPANQYGPSQHNQYPPNQPNQPSQPNQYPHAPSSYFSNQSLQHNASSPSPQLPPIGDLAASGGAPYRSDGLMTTNSYRPSSGRNGSGQDGSSIVSPLTPQSGSRNASLPSMPSGMDNRFQNSPSGPTQMSGGLSSGPPSAQRTDRPDLRSQDTAGGMSSGPDGNYRPSIPGGFPNGSYRSDYQSPGPGPGPGPGSVPAPMSAPGHSPTNNYRQESPSVGPQEGSRYGGPPAVQNGAYNHSAVRSESHVSSNNDHRPGSSRGAAPPAQAPGIFNGSRQGANLPRSNLPPKNPVFGVPLSELFARDGSPVPLIVYQCIQAVDLFGLDVEGIYRTSGSAPHIMEMKALFDHDSSKIDLSNPASFHDDIAAVTTLLKNFLRDLPDPLLTSINYAGFISAAKIDDDIARRDSLHAIINDLPDPNYATLRVLTLHLNRVAEHSASNKMTPHNLAICLGPTLMRQQGSGVSNGGVGADIKDASWQAKVVETILLNTFQIFDDDDF